MGNDDSADVEQYGDLDFIADCDTRTIAPDDIADAILPDYNVPGIPGSGEYRPTKNHIRRQIAAAIRRERT